MLNSSQKKSQGKKRQNSTDLQPWISTRRKNSVLNNANSDSYSNILRQSNSKSSQKHTNASKVDNTLSGLKVVERSGSKSNSRGKKSKQGGENDVIRNLINRKMS